MRPALFRTIMVLYGWAITPLVLLPAKAGGAYPEPELSYHVSGVQRGDTLTVRLQPGIGGEPAGVLESTAQGVIVSGVSQQIQGAEWWEIIYPAADGGFGWVNSTFLSPEQVTTESAANYPIQCIGTEPFWSVTIDEGGVTFSSPESKDVKFTSTSRVAAQGLRGHFVVRIKDVSSDAGPEGAVVVTMAYDYCSDNMSDNRYPFYATAMLPSGAVLGGCCRRASRQ